MNLNALIIEAHGCEAPEARSSFLGQHGENYHYSVKLLRWDVTLEVPLPRFTVVLHLMKTHPAFSPEMPKEHIEAYVDGYQVRPQEAISYALATFSNQQAAVRTYLEERFGPMLGEAKNLGGAWWLAALNP